MDEPVDLALLGLAAYRTAEMLVSDEIPFGSFRRKLWETHPPTKTVAVIDGQSGTRTRPMLDAHGKPVMDSRLGYLFTCVSCMSVWTTAAWWLLHKRAPRLTRVIVRPAAVAGLARYLGSR